MKTLKSLHEELFLMRDYRGEFYRMELATATLQISVIENALQKAQAKIDEEHAEEKFWAQKAELANYKDAEANIAETVYGARVNWYKAEVAKMEAELKKLRRKAKKLLRSINEFDAYAAQFKHIDANAGTNANAEKPATDTGNGAYCFECGQWIEDTEDMDAGMWAQPSHERGTLSETGFDYNDRYGAEFVCTDCLEKHYRQCAKCAEFYHESRCTQDEHGNWLCDNCREDKAE